MKKLVAVILAALVVAVTPVYASEVDLSGMTLEELVELYDQVGKEMALQLGTDGTFKNVPAGTYEIGTDIPAGKYNVMSATEECEPFFTYKSMEDFDEHNTDEGYDSKYCEVTLVELKEGEVLRVFSPLLFAKAVPITFD